MTTQQALALAIELIECELTFELSSRHQPEISVALNEAQCVLKTLLARLESDQNAHDYSR